MGIEIRIIIDGDEGPRSPRPRVTEEEKAQIRRDIAIQRERDERARQKAYPSTNDNSDQKNGTPASQP